MEQALFLLFKKALKNHPTIKNWYGFKNTGTIRKMYCYICDQYIGQDSIKYPMTKTLKNKITDHLNSHLSE